MIPSRILKRSLYGIDKGAFVDSYKGSLQGSLKGSLKRIYGSKQRFPVRFQVKLRT